MLGIIKCGYNLKLKNFEGPLDLLTELIGQAKLDITDIALAEITDQYIHYIRTMQMFNIDMASEFFVMAARLVYIKSRKLLPHLRLEEDTLGEEDEAELLARLKEYKKFRYLGRELGRLKSAGDIYYARGYVRDPFAKSRGRSLDELMVGDLISAVRRYYGSFVRKPIPIKRREVNVEEKMNFILGLLNTKKMVKFSEVAKNQKTKIDKIASFLGSMELGHRQQVLLHQMKLFSDIDIERCDDIKVS
jgi:segregation and condensation protein A